MESGLHGYHKQKFLESLQGGFITGQVAECMTRKVKTDSPGLPSIGSKNTKRFFSFMLVLVIVCIFTLVWEKTTKAKPPKVSKPKRTQKRNKRRQKLHLKVASDPTVNISRVRGALIATADNQLD